MLQITKAAQAISGKKYFEGLNALRFIAAFLVLLMHVKGFFIRNVDAGFGDLPILGKGHTAVSFFFTLSGFLITHLMLQEAGEKGRVAVKKFYLKRVRRIWPLYFLVILIGCLFYFVVLPAANVQTKDSFNIPLVLFFYVFFMSNVPSSFWNVGSILGITWSIGVEEQFYLFWAPLFNFFRKKLLAMFAVIFILFSAVQIFNFHFVNNNGLKALLYTFQFNNMAIGAIAAYFYFNHGDVFKQSFFLSKKWQFLVLACLLYFLFFTNVDHYNGYYNILISLLYVYIILSCAAGPSLFKIKWGPLDYGGKISYGIYMYHSLCIYGASFLIGRFQNLFPHNILFILFVVVSALLTITISVISYEFFERKFLNTQKKTGAFSL